MNKIIVTTISLVFSLQGISFAEMVSFPESSSSLRHNTYSQSLDEPDYDNAIPMPLPKAKINTSLFGFGTSLKQSSSSKLMQPREYGALQHPYTTSRVDGYGRISHKYPYSPTGKLYFNKPDGRTFVCTASLIKKGVLLTAAHCVWEKGGGNRGNYTSFRFQPAKYNSKTPFGTWIAYRPTVLTAWKRGDSKNCRIWGIICNHDVAVLRIQPKTKRGKRIYPGELTGTYDYAVDRYGFTKSSHSELGRDLAQITQLGYPVSHDRGMKLQRTDSLGYIDSNYKNNTIIGSRQDGGASGGPWLVNFDSASSLNGVTNGSDSKRNVVVGVSSWTYTNNNNVLGASKFSTWNITPLINSVCNNYSGC